MPETSIPVAVFADDLTGALEIGALARQSGRSAQVFLSPDSEYQRAMVSICDIGTRDLPPTVAAAVQRYAARHDRDDGSSVILKKTDSLLRGNIAAEFAVLRELFPRRPIVFVPAYPLMGRRVQRGTLQVREISGEWTAKGSVTELFHSHFAPGEILHAASLAELQSIVDQDNPSVVICDGMEQADVDAIGDWLRQQPSRWIVAGPAGVFRSFFSPVSDPPSKPRWEMIPFGVGFVGSQHASSKAQLQVLAESGRAIVAAFQGHALSECAADLLRAGSAGKWFFIHCATERRPEIVLRPFPPAVYLSGGATASLSLLRSGIDQLEPICELLPGVVYSLARHAEGTMPVITKSGAFGDAQTIERILSILQRETIES